MSKDSGAERWPLSSGVWLHDAGSRRWELALTADHRPVSPSIPMADRYWLIGARGTGQSTGDSFQYPPEFQFSPDTREALTAVPLPESAVWIPPFGAAPAWDLPKQLQEPRGLRRAAAGVRLRPAFIGGGRVHAAANPPHSLPPPSPGCHEFCTARFGARRDVLLAIEPEGSDLWAWLPLARLWMPMDPRATGRLADASLVGERWRMELLQQDSVTTMFMPTVAGLASITADAMTLTYSVTYAGAGPALGAPIFWCGEVWAPVGSSPRSLSLVSQTGKVIPVALPVEVEAFAPPVCDLCHIVWPCEQGQLVVSRGAGGAPQSMWVEWPRGITPCFEFSSSYCAQSGFFWQVGWDGAAGSYALVQMGHPKPEACQAGSPRCSTAGFGFQHGHCLKGDLLRDPGNVDQSSSEELVIPLLESAHHAAVLSMRVESTLSVSALLESEEPQRAELRYQEGDDEAAPFFTMLVKKPWRTRVFVYDRRLWIHHPDLQVAPGWDLGN